MSLGEGASVRAWFGGSGKVQVPLGSSRDSVVERLRRDTKTGQEKQRLGLEQQAAGDPAMYGDVRNPGRTAGGQEE